MKYLDLKAVNALVADETLAAVSRVASSGWYLRGAETSQFERHYAEYIGTRHCVGVGNGLDALALILRAYKELGRLSDGDEVIVPANTYIATIIAISDNGLVPVLVEPDIDTLQIDDKLIEPAICPRTRAVMIVHLYGRCAFTPAIADVCRRHGLLLLEDNAQAHGCRFTGDGQLKDARTGSLGDAAAHSFYPTKNLGAMGDAGAVTTDDDELADMVRSLGNYGSSRHYVFDHVGRNSRLDELQAAVLDAKLQHLDAMNERRRQLAEIYISEIHHTDIVVPLCRRDSVYHIFPILSTCRDELRQYLLGRGVQTDIHYPIPPHRQKCFPALHARVPGGLAVTERIHSEELSLPCHPAMTDDDARRVAQALNEASLSL